MQPPNLRLTLIRIAGSVVSILSGALGLWLQSMEQRENDATRKGPVIDVQATEKRP